MNSMDNEWRAYTVAVEKTQTKKYMFVIWAMSKEDATGAVDHALSDRLDANGEAPSINEVFRQSEAGNLKHGCIADMNHTKARIRVSEVSPSGEDVHSGHRGFYRPSRVVGVNQTSERAIKAGAPIFDLVGIPESRRGDFIRRKENGDVVIEIPSAWLTEAVERVGGDNEH